MRIGRSASARAALLGLALLAPGVRAEEGAGSSTSTGEVRLPSGIVARYDYHFDRNALRDSRSAGEHLIALTGSGNLLRFDARTLRLTREWFGPVAVVCLGRGDDDAVMAGFADGRISRIDPITLTPNEVARIHRAPCWIGGYAGEDGPKGLVVVSRPVSAGVDAEPEGPYIIHDLAAGRTHTFTPPRLESVRQYPTAFLLDAKRRLWLGADYGEFGGWCARCDLATGTLHRLPWPIAGEPDDEPAPRDPERTYLWQEVQGFLSFDDGEVWAYGGFGPPSFIFRIDSGRAEILFFGDDPTAKPREWGDAPRPPAFNETMFSLDHIVHDRAAREIYAVTIFGEVFRTDRGLKRWERVLDLSRRVCAVHLPGETEGLVFAQEEAGYGRIAGGRQTEHILPDQFGIGVYWRGITRIEPAAGGSLLINDGPCEFPLRLHGGHWEDVPAHPRSDEGGNYGLWVAEDGSIFTLTQKNGYGRITTAQWRGGHARIIAEEDRPNQRELAVMNEEGFFRTPDGTSWVADTFDGRLKRLVNGRWRPVSRLPRRKGIDGPAKRSGEDLLRFSVGTVGDRLKVLNTDGPPWLIFDREGEQLLRLTDAKGARSRLGFLPAVEGGSRLLVRDAIPWAGGKLLMATPRGLRTLDPDSGRVASVPIAAPGYPVGTLARDGLGRLWLAGQGLWMASPGGKALQRFDALPMLGRTQVFAMGRDVDHPDGIIVSLGPRGVVFLRAEGGRQP